jgi:hypothetical protein
MEPIAGRVHPPRPNYTSLFVANLGSVRLDSAFHHLYEYRNCPLFAAIGRSTTVPFVDARGQLATRTVCSIKYTLDERVEDGLYCATGLERLRHLMEDPEAYGASPLRAPPPEAGQASTG